MARILVVEDDRSLRQLLGVILEQEGHDVVAASDGSEGLKHLKGATPFDVVISDLMMPGVNGFDLLAAMAAPRPKVIVLSAREDRATIERALELGADRYLTKPYSPDDLAGAVAELLA